MRSFGVVMLSPFFDQDLRLTHAVEDFAIEQIIPEPGVEVFTVSVLPGVVLQNAGGLDNGGFDRVQNRLSNEVWAIVRADIGRLDAQDEQLAQGVDHITRCSAYASP